MNMTPEGIAFLVQEEGFMPRKYLCAAGVPTIGVGHVILPNEQRYNTATLTRLEGMNLLQADIDARFGPGVTGKLTRPATPNQLAAMISLCFNIGTAGFAKSSVCRLHNAGSTDSAAITAAFAAWCKITKNGVKVTNPALLARRKREAALYLRG
jgi:lysozyme